MPESALPYCGCEHPVRGALIDEHFVGDRRDSGHDLVGARAGTDDRDTLAVQVDVVVPVSRVKRRAFEGPNPFDVG